MRELIGNIFVISFLTIAISGCISIKSEYPDITYYQLKQEASLIESKVSIEGILQIRDFAVSAEYDTEQILASWGNNRVQKYYYHRWITGISELFTDFLVTRYSRSKAFSGAVVKSNAAAVPDYFLEGQIIELQAVNSESDEPGANFCTITVKVNLIKRDKNKSERRIILSNTYTERTDRRNNTAATIPVAFSKCFSNIADMILVDIQKACNN